LSAAFLFWQLLTGESFLLLCAIEGFDFVGENCVFSPEVEIGFFMKTS